MDTEVDGRYVFITDYRLEIFLIRRQGVPVANSFAFESNFIQRR